VGIQGKVNKTQIHAYKSTFTYAKNTLTCAVFNVATGDDDDGNGAFPNGNGDNGLIDETTAGEIEKLLKDTGANRKGFVNWLKSQGIDGVENIPTSKVPDVTRKIVEAAAKRRGARRTGSPCAWASRPAATSTRSSRRPGESRRVRPPATATSCWPNG
jgi:hypothetical protein